MHCKSAFLVINPRMGQNLAKISEVLAVLAAAGWKTELAIKEYGGQSMELAHEAADNKHDLVIAYGGDGTLNQTVNGIMSSKKQKSIVGVIPGGTANVWAGEVGIPIDPVKAALTLIDSQARKVDVGHVAVQGLKFPDLASSEAGPQETDKKKARKAKTKIKALKDRPGVRHHFLLMAGLGIDAAIMGEVSKPLKYRIGPLAVGLSAAKELPKQRAFAVEIRSNNRDGAILWQGEALQVVIGNTRRYANITEMTPNAYIDDGVLDVCVITAGDPLTTMQQISSLLLRRKPDNVTAEFFHGTHLSVTVPSTVPLQVDGNAVKLKDYLRKADLDALLQVDDPKQVLATYTFDALPHALEVAVPYTYDDTLFEHTNGHVASSAHRESASNGEKAHVKSHHEDHPQTEQQQHTEAELTQSVSQLTGKHHEQPASKPLVEEHHTRSEQINALLDRGRKVAVVGKVPDPEKQRTYIIAGNSTNSITGMVKPAAVIVNSDTSIYNQDGEHLPFTAIRDLQEGANIVVEGKQSKRGVIEAKSLVV